MNPRKYAVDDVIVLKTSLMRAASDDRTCRIVGLLPASDRGEQQYRVRVGDESFERRILASDIDTAAATEHEATAETSKATAGSPWLKPASIRVGK
jgi:hypothetical protein